MARRISTIRRPQKKPGWMEGWAASAPTGVASGRTEALGESRHSNAKPEIEFSVQSAGRIYGSREAR